MSREEWTWNLLTTAVGQAIASSNPAGGSWGVQGADVSIASPTAAFRGACRLRKVQPKGLGWNAESVTSGRARVLPCA